MPVRIIAHLDMDAFYASVELLRYPLLRGRPLVVGGRRRADVAEDARADAGSFPTLREYAGRGVITTATYEARALGVSSGMGLMKAARLAPDALLLPADFDRYRACSRSFKEAVRRLAPQIEDRGIDEIYIDLTEQIASGEATAIGSSGPQDRADAAAWARARSLAIDIQRAVRETTGLSCSIGVTPNKLLSKIASDLEKPGGITVLDESDIPGRIWPLPARRINGIGPKANARLEALGIRTIGELAATDPALLMQTFGRSFGAWLNQAAHGRDDRPVVTFSEPRSVSRETTFERDLHPVRDREQLSGIFTDLCERLAADLQRKGYAGKTIGLKLRYDDFSQVTRDRTIDRPTQQARVIRRAAGECLKRVPLDRRIRLLGVRMGALVPASGIDPDASADAPEVVPPSLPGENATLFE